MAGSKQTISTFFEKPSDVLSLHKIYYSIHNKIYKMRYYWYSQFTCSNMYRNSTNQYHNHFFFYGHGANKQYTILTIQVKLTLDWRASKHQLLGCILVKIGWIHPSQDQLIFNGALTIPDCWDKYLLIYFIHL